MQFVVPLGKDIVVNGVELKCSKPLDTWGQHSPSLECFGSKMGKMSKLSSLGIYQERIR